MSRSRVFRLAVALPAAVAAAVLIAEPALAGATVSTTGASLMCNVYKTGRWSGYADCWLSDTLGDNKQVYAVTQMEAFPQERVSNNGGGGTTLSFRKNIGTDSRFEFQYKVCRKVNLGSDNCSSWARVVG
jgi:hypothetical protein